MVQLHFVKPTELVQLLQPFSSGVPNAVFPIDSSQIIVLRDLTENVKRMLELITEIDIAVPSEFVNEVIPIKYAKAPEIASAPEQPEQRRRRWRLHRRRRQHDSLDPKHGFKLWRQQDRHRRRRWLR